MIDRRWLLALLGAGLLAARGQAKPMESPSLEEALKSDAVVEAEYRDCHPQGKVDYFAGVLATFRVTQSLKGRYRPGQEILVDYAFHDGSACLPPPDFDFSKAMMPPVGKKFVLFLRGKKGSCGTYRGDFGRMASTPRLLETVRHKLHP